MKTVPCFLLLVSWTLANNVFAQLSEADTLHWNINASFSGKLNSGNVQRLLLMPDVTVTQVAANRKYGFALAQRYAYRTFGRLKAENDLLSRNFFYLNPAAKQYPFIMVWIQVHERQRLQLRYQAGVGITRVVKSSVYSLLKLSLTATYEQNWYKEPGLVHLKNPDVQQYNVVRATTRLAGSNGLFKRLISLYYEGYFQQALNNGRNWRVFAESGLQVRATNAIGVKVFATYEYQKVHVATELPNDLIINFGLTYRWQKGKRNENE